MNKIYYENKTVVTKRGKGWVNWVTEINSLVKDGNLTSVGENIGHRDVTS